MIALLSSAWAFVLTLIGDLVATVIDWRNRRKRK